jgi:hypothetical protein
MSQAVKPLAEITHDAINLLVKNMGASDAMRFVRQYTLGYGDYTMERDELFKDLSVDDIMNEIEEMRKNSSSNRPL